MQRILQKILNRNKIKLLIFNNQAQIPVMGELKKLFHLAAEVTLSEAYNKKFKSTEISLTLCDNLYIHELNKQYRNIDKPTDVLSFPLLALGEVPPVDEVFLLGDIIVSTEKAEEQAREFDHSLKRELIFLFVHGLLHLLGYDHETADDEADMFAKQKKIMNMVGLSV